nr:alginate O-acetyltransferase [uncultured Pseudomonas sp.]
MSRTWQKTYVALFLGVLVSLSLWSLRGVASYHLPKTLSVFDGGLAKTFESHYDKQFPVKELGTNVWAALQYVLFNTGRPGVMIGEHGWLYSAEEFQPVADGTQHLRENLRLIEGVRNYLAQRDIRLLLAIVPAKSRLYPEYVGDNHVTALRQDSYQRLHQEAQRLGIPAPDLLTPLQAAKSEGLLFMRTDTHWTPKGADIVARQLSDAIKRNFQLSGEPQTFITEASQRKPYQGDLTRFLPLAPLFEQLMPEPDQLQRYKTHLPQADDDANALFADSELPVALVGTSYSANPNWNFAGALREHLQRDLSNYAEDGQGPILPMLRYLQSDELNDAPAQVVIWEFPERYLPMANDFSDFDATWLAELKNSSTRQNLASRSRH